MDRNGHGDVEGVRGIEEPFVPHERPGPDQGVFPQIKDQIITPRETIIKTMPDAPYLVVCIPVGGRDETDVFVDEGGTRHQIRPGESYRVPGMVPAELLMNFAMMQRPLGVAMSFQIMKNNLSAHLREEMTKAAIEAGASYIFYWDDDVIIPSMTWYTMLAKMKKHPDIGIISGVYFSKREPTEPIIYRQAGEGAYWDWSVDPSAEPEDIFAAGAGCMMARVDAIKQMEAPYWMDERRVRGDHRYVQGHDFRFCRKMREEAGYRVTVDGSIQCMHLDVKNQKGYAIPRNFKPRGAAQPKTKVTHGEVVDVDEVEAIMEASCEPARDRE